MSKVSHICTNFWYERKFVWITHIPQKKWALVLLYSFVVSWWKTFATNEVLSSMYNIYLSFFLKLFFLLSTFYQHYCLNLLEESQRWECTLYRAQNQLFLFLKAYFKLSLIQHFFKKQKIKKSFGSYITTFLFF